MLLSALVLTIIFSRTLRTASFSYPEYIPDDARCIVQLDGKVDVTTVLGNDAIFMGIPNFYTIDCFSPAEPPIDAEPDVDAYDSVEDEEAMTYEEKVEALDELASRAGVIAVYPDISLSVKVPATLSNYTAAPAAQSGNCTSPAHDWLWYITGEYITPDGKKKIKTLDINITEVWNKSYTGQDTIIQMLLVGGVSQQNKDISDRIDGVLSQSFIAEGENETYTMGTSLAALAVGSVCNDYGADGVAPESSLVVMAYNKTDVLLSELLLGLYPAAYLKHLNDTATETPDAPDIRTSYKTSVIATSFLLDGCSDGCCTVFDDVPWLSTAMIDGAITNSAVYLFSASDEGHTDTNIYPFLRNPGAIVVGAVSPIGKPDDEITFGSNIVFSVPVNGTVDGTNLSLITSTSPSACNYTDSNQATGCLVGVSGPAGALSIAAGAVAIIGQALNRTYNVRDILHIMAISSQIVNNKTQFDEKNGWVLNDNGFFFSNKYGFGLLNIDKAVSIAESWPVLPNATYASFLYNETEKLGADDHVDIHITVPEKNMMRLERVQLAVSLTTGFAGDIIIDVTSPAGTTSRILDARKADISDSFSDNVYLLTNAFFGEASPGDWKVRIHNRHKISSARINSVRLMITGVAQTTHLTFAKSYDKIYSDSTVHLKWRPATCGLVSAATVDFWITDRFHNPIILIASNVSYGEYEYKWDAFKIPLEKGTRGFFMMVPHNTANITPHQWLPGYVYSPLVRFHLADSEPAAGAFMRPSAATVATIGAVLAITALVLK